MQFKLLQTECLQSAQQQKIIFQYELDIQQVILLIYLFIYDFLLTLSSQYYVMCNGMMINEHGDRKYVKEVVTLTFACAD